jgi:hypothetical protein
MNFYVQYSTTGSFYEPVHCSSLHQPFIDLMFHYHNMKHDLRNSCSCMNVSSFQGEITKKLRMLATDRLKYFFSLSPSCKHAAEKGKKKL